jgi:hypothetical protein
VYHDREAELKERVDRARVRIAYASARERAIAAAAVRAFARDLSILSPPAQASELDVIASCESAEAAVPR